jgi:hypothetical protein
MQHVMATSLSRSKWKRVCKRARGDVQGMRAMRTAHFETGCCAQAAPPPALMPLEVLHRAFVPFGGCA